MFYYDLDHHVCNNFYPTIKFSLKSDRRDDFGNLT